MLALMPLMAMAADNEWHPIASWPFTYQDFNTAIIITSTNQKLKAKANLHVGSHYLWYENSAKKKLEAKVGTIQKVVFPGNETYYAIDKKLCKVLREDTINGKVCRLYVSHEVDKAAFDERTKINRQAMQNLDVGIAGIADMYSEIADREGAAMIEEEPLPMRDLFYMLYGGETFLVNETNILKHLSKEERNAYRSFTRSAEIIYGNESSIINVWLTFFVK